MGSFTDAARRHFSELRRRRVVSTLVAYVVVPWLLLQVADVTFEPLGFTMQARRRLILAAAIGIVPVAVLAGVFATSGRGVARTGALESPDAPLPVERRAPVPPAPPAAKGEFSAIASIAILPFADLSPGHDQAWFCDGLAEEIIDSLC